MGLDWNPGPKPKAECEDEFREPFGARWLAHNSAQVRIWNGLGAVPAVASS